MSASQVDEGNRTKQYLGTSETGAVSRSSVIRKHLSFFFFFVLPVSFHDKPSQRQIQAEDMGLYLALMCILVN